MRKSAQVRAVYAELRQMLGDEASAGDVLKLAHIFLRAYSDPPDEMREFGVAGESRPFLTLPVDDAMSDGGWRVLIFERERSAFLDRRDPIDMARFEPLLTKYLGPEWLQYRLTGQL